MTKEVAYAASVLAGCVVGVGCAYALVLPTVVQSLPKSAVPKTVNAKDAYFYTSATIRAVDTLNRTIMVEAPDRYADGTQTLSVTYDNATSMTISSGKAIPPTDLRTNAFVFVQIPRQAGPLYARSIVIARQN